MIKYTARRRWRGVRDTLEDFAWWLRTWQRMLKFLLSSPVQVVKGLRKYELTESFSAVPAIIDSFTGSAAGARLREKHREMDDALKSCLTCAEAVFAADESIGGNGTCPAAAVCIDGGAAESIMHGFPNVRTVELSALELLFGKDRETLPEAGACSIVSAAGDEKKRQKIPPSVFELTGAAENIVECIRFTERQTGEKFDWDAFTEYMRLTTGEKSIRPAEAVEMLARRRQ